MCWGGSRQNLTLQQTSLMSQQSAPGVYALWSLSAVLCSSRPILLILCLAYYNPLIYYLSPSNFLSDFDIQQSSMCLSLIVRPFTSWSLDSLSLSHADSVRLVRAQIYYSDLPELLSHLLTHTMANIMHMLLLPLYRYVHWSYKGPRADKQRWINVVSTKWNSPLTPHERPWTENVPWDKMDHLKS